MSQIQGIPQTVFPVADAPSLERVGAASESGGFLDSLKSAIGQVNNAQRHADQAIDALMTGQSQDIHRTMVAMQEASVSFQLMMQIRNKLVAAYEEIQRMQV
jgi:flagellar hook-basal body complex protein FliE